MLLKRFLLLLIFGITVVLGFAQPDTMWIPPPKPKIPTHLRFAEIGAAWQDGNLQFFDGYTQEKLYADAKSGLPLYNDWNVYSYSTILPAFFQFSGFVGFVDTTKNLRLKLGITYYQKHDSLNYSGGFALNDTVFGRVGAEFGRYYGVSVSGSKMSRKFLKIVRFYGGAEIDLALSLGGPISFSEYSYDFGDQVIVEQNDFFTEGNPRLNLFGSAFVGLELTPWSRFSLFAELQSGLGVHLIPGGDAFGLSRNAYSLGTSWFIFKH